ncbi:MAG TPA: ATP-binding protein [Thermoanaerobaculia bacterium]|nr:ATP-binding protein [Thermoanaerobaculia bacterium]
MTDTSEMAQAPFSEELVYAPAIVILADDLYPRKLEIIREYIQNASDALDSYGRVADILDDTSHPVIKVSVQGQSLLIWDNGVGMDATEITKLKRIAYSEKKRGRDAGHKGIGRLAGIAVASKLIISSTSVGDPLLHRFEFDARALHNDIDEGRARGHQEAASVVLNRHITISSVEIDPHEHYTMVELHEINDPNSPLLDPIAIREYIGDIGPVGFSPEFRYAAELTEALRREVPDFSPKTVWLSTSPGVREQVYKPYVNEMHLAKPEMLSIRNDTGEMLAFCWYAAKGQEFLGRLRPAGKIFSVPGKTKDEKRRYAGLVYKLFGLSVGDRGLVLRTIWPAMEFTRALWFTGEIHIVDKDVSPTTDRSNFVESEATKRLYSAAQKLLAKPLNRRAEAISEDRLTFASAEKATNKIAKLEQRLAEGKLAAAQVKATKAEIDELINDNLQRTSCKDADIAQYVRETVARGRALRKRIDEMKARGGEERDRLRDVAGTLTTQGRKVYTIVMEVLEQHYADVDDLDTFHELSDKIHDALRKKLL